MRDATYRWNPDDSNGPILKVTKSSLMSFKWCPLKYKFSYIDGRKIIPNAAMIKGTKVHKAQEEFWEQFDIKKAEDLPDDDIIEYIRGLFPAGTEYDGDFDTIAAFESQRLMDERDTGSIDNFVPVAVELSLASEIELDGIPIHINGKIDIIFREENGFIPFELKTGKWNDNKLPDMRTELSFYKLLMESSKCQFLPVSLWAWFFSSANYLCVEKPKKTYATLFNRIRKLIDAYMDNNFPPKFYYGTCKYCDFKDDCPAFSPSVDEYGWFS